MPDLTRLPVAHWDQPCSPEQQRTALQGLEDGAVLVLPGLGFSLTDAEQPFLADSLPATAKNISLNPATGVVGGIRADDSDVGRLRTMLARYAQASQALLGHLLPGYVPAIRRGRTSFRPTEVAGRSTSWRQDDTRLHVDSFPSTPMRGERILRVFTNVHPGGRCRTWRLGEPFEAVARRYLPTLQRPLWGSSAALELLGITKGRRSDYDHTMLQLHDRMKADAAYQAQAPQSTAEFAPGSTWLVYTDAVSHAAMAGQHAFEQTFYLPVADMADAAKSPLRVLERLLRRKLV